MPLLVFSLYRRGYLPGYPGKAPRGIHPRHVRHAVLPAPRHHRLPVHPGISRAEGEGGTRSIPKNRENKKWKFSFSHQRHALLTSFNIFVVTYMWLTFCQNWSTCYYFPQKKLIFFNSLFFGIARNTCTTRSHTKVWMPYGHIPQQICGILHERFVWNIFVSPEMLITSKSENAQLYQRLVPEVIKQLQ